MLDSKKIPYTEIDVAAPHQLDEKVFMQKTLQLNDDDLVALPPQIFNNNKYRGVRACFLGVGLCKVDDFRLSKCWNRTKGQA